MADWFHCNSCFATPQSACVFSLSSCGHLYCNNCLQKGAINPVCKICHCKASVVEVNSQLQRDVQLFFLSPAEVLKKDQEKLTKILEFQNGHRSRFVKHMENQMKKLAKVALHYQEDAKSKQEQLTGVQCRLDQLKDENQQLKHQINQLLLKEGELRGKKHRPKEFQKNLFPNFDVEQISHQPVFPLANGLAFNFAAGTTSVLPTAKFPVEQSSPAAPNHQTRPIVDSSIISTPRMLGIARNGGGRVSVYAKRTLPNELALNMSGGKRHKFTSNLLNDQQQPLENSKKCPFNF